MGLKVTNNAFGTLNAGINSSVTTVVLAAGQGSLFPTLTAGDYFYATLIDTSNNLEIVKVTARSTDTMTIVRGQDNTTARAYSTNDRFELRPTAALFNEKADTVDVTASLAAKQDLSSALTTYASTGVGMRNRIINGAMIVDQRQSGAQITAAGNVYTIDRFLIQGSQTGKFNVQQVSDAPSGFFKSLKITVGTAVTISSGDYFIIRQAIEGNNVADLGWGAAGAQTVTLSFWVKSSLTGTFSGHLTNNASARWYPYTYTISAANTWEYKTITITGDTTGTWLTDNGMGIYVGWSLGTGSSNEATANAWTASTGIGTTGSVDLVATGGATIQWTGVQFEKGSTATPFEHRQYGVELGLCHRYYYRSLSQGNHAQHYNILGRITATNQSVFTMNLPVDMRASPSTALNPAYNTGSGWQSNLASVDNRAWSSAPAQLSPQFNTAVFYVMTASWPSQYVGMVVDPYTPTGVGANFLEISAEL